MGIWTARCTIHDDTWEQRLACERLAYLALNVRYSRVCDPTERRSFPDKKPIFCRYSSLFWLDTIPAHHV